MVFLVLLSALCYISILLTQLFVSVPMEFFGWVHLPSVVLWGTLLLLLAWFLGGN
ncbi:hypothetical protein [Parathermosynechococcus lividus]